MSKTKEHEIVDGGKIELITGPMFSGKTLELMNRMKRHAIAGRKGMIIKWDEGKKDRYHNKTKVTNHDQIQMNAYASKTLMKFKKDLKDIKVIGIDEGQFFPDLVSFCLYCEKKGKIIIIAALISTFERKLFPHIQELLPKCEIHFLKAVCMFCHKDNASFTCRTSHSTRTNLIGGKKLYKACCGTCYLKFLKSF